MTSFTSLLAINSIRSTTLDGEARARFHRPLSYGLISGFAATVYRGGMTGNRVCGRGAKSL